MKYHHSFMLGNRRISERDPTYFIADIGANHDGSLERAKELIKLAADCGIDCAKFQHFKADRIVSREGFSSLKVGHQADWKKPVYETYEDYSINRDWNEELALTCESVGIDFMTTPYDFEAVDSVDPLVRAFKIGSGDITYHSLIHYIAACKKPVFLATGASTTTDVYGAVSTILDCNPKLCLMQCNTNYTGDAENISHVNLKVLASYARCWPHLPLGLSDHTSSDTSVLGAVALGARVIEKHFTDDITRKGPDHAFAITPGQWHTMRFRVRQMEAAMGDGIKKVEENEQESVVVQRRALRVKRSLPVGAVLVAEDLEALRPCPPGAYTPADIHKIIGHHLAVARERGDALFPDLME